MFKNRILMRISLLLVGLLLVAGSSAFVVQKALAGSCFADVADGSFWWSVTCWMKAKGISTGYADGTYRPDWGVSRGEMALFIQRAFSNSSQVAYLTTGPTQWTANAAYPSAYVKTFWGWSHLRSSAVGGGMFNLSPTIPTSLYNTLYYAKGIKICFDATAAGGYVDFIEIKHLYYTSLGFTEINTITDNTDRATKGCVVVNFTTPRETWGSDQVTVNLQVQFNSTGYIMYIGTTSIVVYPSTSYAALGLDSDPLMLDRVGISPASDDPTSGLLP